MLNDLNVEKSIEVHCEKWEYLWINESCLILLSHFENIEIVFSKHSSIVSIFCIPYSLPQFFLLSLIFFFMHEVFTLKDHKLYPYDESFCCDLEKCNFSHCSSEMLCSGSAKCHLISEKIAPSNGSVRSSSKRLKKGPD